MWEAFLLQMNDFDSFLELKLRRMLDPVVTARPPRRRRPGSKRTADTVLEVAAVELAVEAIPVVAPVIVPSPRLIS